MRVSRPVCGCNGKTYANDCERQRVKVQLDHVGACPKEPKAKEPKAGKK
ncbi:Kazal-type serine protease inhibitor domain [Mycobacterium tuberculosis]|nr:Kazal-type serine protease inhibitor domain-containing protein [Afipia birgiae]CKZ53393.1 Kazal-type serine protease inhibitor domain [Mycobacterium tuberculosis]